MAEPVLLSGLVSPGVVTVAMLSSVPAGTSSSTRTVIVMVTTWPTATAPIGQVMVAPAAVQPAELLTYVVCAGSVSVTVPGVLACVPCCWITSV